jgi:hypothetical protein
MPVKEFSKLAIWGEEQCDAGHEPIAQGQNGLARVAPYQWQS